MEKIYERLIQMVGLDNIYYNSVISKHCYLNPFQGNVDVDMGMNQRLEY